MTKATYTGKDVNAQDGITIYWFEIEGEVYGVGETEHDVVALDCDGAPIDYNENVARMVLDNCIVTDEMRAE